MAVEAADRRQPEPYSTFELHHGAGIRVGDDLITPADLRQDEDEIGHVHPRRLLANLSLEEQVGLVSESFLLRNILLRMMPIAIYGDTSRLPVLLDAFVKRFELAPGEWFTNLAPGQRAAILRQQQAVVEPVNYAEQSTYVSYGLRLMPTTGRVEEVAYRFNPKLSFHGADRIATNDRRVAMSLHNSPRSLYVEIYKNPQPEEELPPLISPRILASHNLDNKIV